MPSSDMKEEIEEFIWNWLYWLYWAIGLIMLGTYFMGWVTLFWGIIMFAVLLFLLRFVFYKIHQAEIRRLRDKIRDYRPNEWTTRDVGDEFYGPSRVRLGVCGVQDSGKSSFLNSLHFAFKGSWEEVYVEKGNASAGGETMFRDPARLSNNLTTYDTRGLIDLSEKKVEDVITEITGKRGLNTRSHAPGEKIDCPIFILKYSPATGTKHCTDFLESLVPEVRKHLCGYPIMVVTFADCIDNREEILGEVTRAGMEKGSVFFIENYTAVNHKMDSKKHIALLKILEACIKRADENISFRWLAEKETPKWPYY